MKKLILVLLALVLSMHATACWGSDDVIIQLKWYHQAQFAGYYVALEEGMYEEEDLNVRLVEGGPASDKIDQLMAGIVDFAVDSPENLLLHRQSGHDVVAIAVLYQRNPLVFITRADSGLVRPHDFVGATAAILSTDQSELQFFAMFEKLGLDIDRVSLLPYDYEYSAFYDGSVDITLSYINGGLIRIRDMGYDVNLIWPGDYGVRMYSDALMTTRTMIEQHPDVVNRVVRATLAGWEQAIARPDKAVNTTLHYAREADRELQLRMMLASIPLLSVGTTPIGWMEPEIWASMVRILTDYGVLHDGMDATQAYDRQFVEQLSKSIGNR